MATSQSTSPWGGHMKRHAGVVLALGSAVVVVAGSAAGGAAAGPSAPSKQSLQGKVLGSTHWRTFHFTTSGGTTLELSTDGNILSYLSPDSTSNGRYEHIGVGARGEGYVLCYGGPTGAIKAFDTGTGNVGFGPSTDSPLSAVPATVTRKTSNGQATLTQKFAFVGVQRELDVTMSVKNNTGSTLSNVILRRQVDFDTDTGGADGWANFQNTHAATTHTSVIAYNPASKAPAGKEAHGMMLRHLSVSSNVGANSNTALVTTDILESACDPATVPGAVQNGTVNGDFGDTMRYKLGSIGPGATKSVTMAYIRF